MTNQCSWQSKVDPAAPYEARVNRLVDMAPTGQLDQVSTPSHFEVRLLKHACHREVWRSSPGSSRWE